MFSPEIFEMQFGNWGWRLPSSTSFDSLNAEAERLRGILAMYGRVWWSRASFTFHQLPMVTGWLFLLIPCKTSYNFHVAMQILPYQHANHLFKLLTYYQTKKGTVNLLPSCFCSGKMLYGFHVSLDKKIVLIRGNEQRSIAGCAISPIYQVSSLFVVFGLYEHFSRILQTSTLG